ncbi:MAG TPA: FAD-dependent oxidoreductase [Candidatus Competibacter sp.]|nr:FAD-dependent oxidoreductase [Candidatus Competibacter sp.]
MNPREDNIRKLGQGVFDALIVGSGINGAVAAAALSGRGARVALIDRHDFAGFTSQQSSNLIWGGIKYLESHDYPLVRRLCLSRNHLIRHYPSQVRQIRFMVTIDRGFRWHPLSLWAGAGLYWLFGNGFTEIPRLLSKRAIQREEPVIRIDKAVGGFEYSDAYLPDNDARFVFQFVRSAMDQGCVAANYVESLGAHRVGDLWITLAQDAIDRETIEIRAKVLINAAGPFVDEHNRLTGEQTEHRHLFSKGVHLIVPRITSNRRILAFFADDGRLFFVIPLGTRACIGTTDTPVESPYVEVTEDDRRFVLENINKRLNLPRPLTSSDIIAERCGVRPLIAAAKADGDIRDWSRLSRKHEIEVDRAKAHLSIFGGKLTDCLNVGDEISEIVAGLGIVLPRQDSRWYGEPHRSVRKDYLRQAERMNLDSYRSSEAAESLTDRLWRRYGAKAFELLEAIRQDPRQAESLIRGTEYIRCEIEWAKRQEMIVKLEDFLRRRSEIALVMRREDIRNAAGLMEACEILFEDRARERFDEYFRSQPAIRSSQVEYSGFA